MVKIPYITIFIIFLFLLLISNKMDTLSFNICKIIEIFITFKK